MSWGGWVGAAGNSRHEIVPHRPAIYPPTFSGGQRRVCSTIWPRVNGILPKELAIAVLDSTEFAPARSQTGAAQFLDVRRAFSKGLKGRDNPAQGKALGKNRRNDQAL